MNYAATIGTFDGLHLGHTALLERLGECARSRGLHTMAVTFATHPLSVVAPARMPKLLSTDAERIRALRESGLAEAVVVLDFDAQLRALTARQFMEQLHAVGVRMLLMGHDNAFGSDRLRGLAAYQEIGREVGIEVVECDAVATVDGRAVSSSAVRAALADGDVSLAARMLGRPYSLGGEVVHGRGDGHKLGFPTANLAISPALCIPASGVYACRATVAATGPLSCLASEGTITLSAMVNIGVCPTLTAGQTTTVEAHIIGLPPEHADLYGQRISLAFLARLRAERRFPSLQALQAQLHADAAAACAAARQGKL